VFEADIRSLLAGVAESVREMTLQLKYSS
jgi:hypothetical protein